MILGALIAVWGLSERSQWLSRIDFRVSDPGVPESILGSIREAEAEYYASRPLMRQVFEHAEDVLTFAAPRITYAANLSVGPYRIRARSIEEALPWAIEHGFLSAPSGLERNLVLAQAYFSEQPGLAKWQSEVLVAQLRERHPLMRNLAWEHIAADRALVAKLYSGYMGAGGAWELWKSDLKPGPEAMRRMGL